MKAEDFMRFGLDPDDLVATTSREDPSDPWEARYGRWKARHPTLGTVYTGTAIEVARFVNRCLMIKRSKRSSS